MGDVVVQPLTGVLRGEIGRHCLSGRLHRSKRLA